MSQMQILYLLGAGLAAAVGQIGVTLAYSFAAAKDISIFTYASIIFTAILGFILFGESPDFYATLGYVVIIGASYYMFEKARRDAKIIKINLKERFIWHMAVNKMNYKI